MQDLTFIETNLRMPLMDLPVRSVIVKLGSHSVLISPGSKIPRDQYKAEYGITDIVAPNMFHGVGVPKALSIYKEAKTWACPGLSQKRPDITWSNSFEKDPWPYEKDLKAIHLKGMPKVNEMVFIHKPSRSLIVSDFCFNLTQQRGFGAQLILRLFGTYKRFGVSRFFTLFAKDRAALHASLKELFLEDFDNIIVSHGQNLLGDAKNLLRKSLYERGFPV